MVKNSLLFLVISLCTSQLLFAQTEILFGDSYESILIELKKHEKE